MNCICTDFHDGIGGVIARWLRTNLRDALHDPRIGRAALGLTEDFRYVSPVRVMALSNLRFLRSRPSGEGRVHRVQLNATAEFLFSGDDDPGFLTRVRHYLEDAALVQRRAVDLTLVLDLLVDKRGCEVQSSALVAVASDQGEMDFETGFASAAATA